MTACRPRVRVILLLDNSSGGKFFKQIAFLCYSMPDGSMVETGYLAELFVELGSLPFVFLAANGMIS
jgi:hypothetical protein